MGEHRLTRLYEAGGGLLGELVTAGGQRFPTIERPWLSNRVGVSCVRPGRYELVRWPTHRFTGFSHVYALRGGDVGLLPGPGIARSTIEIHPANFWRDLRGCIGLGLRLGPTGTTLVESRAAVRRFVDELDAATDETHWLEITGGVYGPDFSSGDARFDRGADGVDSGARYGGGQRDLGPGRSARAA